MPPALPAQLEIHPLRQSFDKVVRIPGSKSLTNRALLLAALAEGQSTLTNVLFADDTRVMMAALRKLGVTLDIDEANTTVTVTGCGGPLPEAVEPIELFLGNAGTAVRPLAAALLLGHGTFTLTGVPRMHERPIGELVDPLRELGASIEYPGKQSYPPLRINAHGLRGGAITMRPTLSSQFITALLMAAPLMRQGLTIRFEGPITSQAYVAMTIGMLGTFGIAAQVDAGWTKLTVEPGRYQAADYPVEPDASNATYLLAAAAVMPGSRCTIPCLGERGLQGDAGFVGVLEQMGASVTRHHNSTTVSSPPVGKPLRAIDHDFNAMPDAAMTVATLAVLAQGSTVIRNVGNWRVKETDRMAAMQAELTKLGAAVRIDGDDIHITPPPDGRTRPALIETYDDHRMAMSFAVIGLAQPGVTINDPACVNKTFPTFWQTLNELAPAGETVVDLPDAVESAG